MKKKLPYNIIKNFQPKENDNIFLIRPENGEEFLLHFSDVDSESDFYFRIVQFNDKDNKFLVEHIPANVNSNAKTAGWLALGDLNNRFDSWLKILSDYNETESIFDDLILKGFQEEYYSSFEIIDEDAERMPLKSNQILLLDQHLTEIEERINEFETDENKNVISDIKSDIIELKSDLTKKPKKWVIKKLCLIWGKMTKQGPIIIKEFLTEGKKELIKQGVKIIIENAVSIMN